MNAWTSLFASLIAVIALVLVALFGVGAIGLDTLFGVVIPYVAIALFVLGIIYRIVSWAKVPVPFRIPTTCGQGKSGESQTRAGVTPQCLRIAVRSLFCGIRRR